MSSLATTKDVFDEITLRVGTNSPSALINASKITSLGALPSWMTSKRLTGRSELVLSRSVGLTASEWLWWLVISTAWSSFLVRSEERRVGKACSVWLVSEQLEVKLLRLR